MGVQIAGAGLGGARWAAFGVPIVLGLFDGAILAGIVVDVGRCATDCLAGAALSVLAPVATPLRVAAGHGESTVVLTLGSVIVVVGLAAVWWWTLTGIARDLGRRTERPRATFWGCWLIAVVATVLVSAVTSAVAQRGGMPLAVALELGVWAAVVLLAPLRGDRATGRSTGPWERHG